MTTSAWLSSTHNFVKLHTPRLIPSIACDGGVRSSFPPNSTASVLIALLLGIAVLIFLRYPLGKLFGDGHVGKGVIRLGQSIVDQRTNKHKTLFECAEELSRIIALGNGIETAELRRAATAKYVATAPPYCKDKLVPIPDCLGVKQSESSGEENDQIEGHVMMRKSHQRSRRSSSDQHAGCLMSNESLLAQLLDIHRRVKYQFYESPEPIYWGTYSSSRLPYIGGRIASFTESMVKNTIGEPTIPEHAVPIVSIRSFSPSTSFSAPDATTPPFMSIVGNSNTNGGSGMDYTLKLCDVLKGSDAPDLFKKAMRVLPTMEQYATCDVDVLREKFILLAYAKAEETLRRAMAEGEWLSLSLPKGLPKDERYAVNRERFAAIYVYTSQAIHYKMNKALTGQPVDGAVPSLAPYLPFLRLLFAATDAIRFPANAPLPRKSPALTNPNADPAQPYRGQHTVFRGALIDGTSTEVRSQYPAGVSFVWWSVTSTTIDVNQAHSYRGISSQSVTTPCKTTTSVLFVIETKGHAVTITHSSFYPNEMEYILMPGTTYITVRIEEKNDPHIDDGSVKFLIIYLEVTGSLIKA